MSRLPVLDPDTGLLPPGRYAASLEELYDALVAAPPFTDSATRKRLWDEWKQHRVIVEAEAGEITRMWLAGSFASDKLDPTDVDTTYLLRAEVYDRLDHEMIASLDDLTDRTWCVEHGMHVDAYLVRLPDEMPFWRMTPSGFELRTNDSFRDIGLYDEVWQCIRTPLATDGVIGQSRRGYVEVLL